MNNTEQMFAPELIIPTDSGFTYGWGYCPEGSEGGMWTYVKGKDYEGQPFEHWAFMRHSEVKLLETDPDKFFQRFGGLSEVVEINRNLAWRTNNCKIRLWGN